VSTADEVMAPLRKLEELVAELGKKLGLTMARFTVSPGHGKPKALIGFVVDPDSVGPPEPDKAQIDDAFEEMARAEAERDRERRIEETKNNLGDILRDGDGGTL